MLMRAQHDVFLGAHCVYQLEVLMNHAYAQFIRISRRIDLHFAAVYVDRTRIGTIYARYHVHKRSFAGTVLAQQRQYFAMPQCQIDIIVRNNF